MNQRLPRKPVYLAARELLDIHDGQGFAVTCLEGVLWVTQSNDPRDVVIKTGQSFVLDRPGLALVCAPIGPAAVVIEGARSRRPAAASGRGAMAPVA